MVWDKSVSPFSRVRREKTTPDMDLSLRKRVNEDERIFHVSGGDVCAHTQMQNAQNAQNATERQAVTDRPLVKVNFVR